MQNNQIELKLEDFLKLGNLLLNDDPFLRIDQIKEEFSLFLEKQTLINKKKIDKISTEFCQKIDDQIILREKKVQSAKNKFIIGGSLLCLGFLGFDTTLTNLIIKIINKNG